MKFRKIASFSELLPHLRQKPLKASMAQELPDRTLPTVEQELGVPCMDTEVTAISESVMLRSIALLQSERVTLVGSLDGLLQEFCFHMHSRIEQLEDKPVFRRNGNAYRLDTVKTLIRPDHRGIDISCYAIQECLSPSEEQERELDHYRKCLNKYGTYTTSAGHDMVYRQNFQLNLASDGPMASRLLNLTTSKGEQWLQQNQIGWKTTEEERKAIAGKIEKLTDLENSLASVIREYLSMALHTVALDLIWENGIEFNGHRYVLLGNTIPYVDFSHGHCDSTITIHLIRNDWRELDLENHLRRYIERLDGCTNINREAHAPDLVREGIIIEVPYQTRWMPRLNDFRTEFKKSISRIISNS